MIDPGRRDWLTLVLIGLAILLMPAVFLLLTLEALILFGDIELADLTLVQLVELYLLDLAVLLAFAYAVYRVTLYAVEEQLPKTLDRIDAEERRDDDE